jgi:hypothetical protein
MTRDEFLLNLRTAAQFLSPTVQVNGIRLDPGYLEDVLRGATIWLTPKAVEGFDPDDFAELSADDRQRLIRAVEQFREIASQVPRDAPATDQQIREAAPAFISILTIVRPYLEMFKIYHALKRESFPDYVKDFAVKVGEDSTGDPAAWIWVIIADRVGGREFITKVPEVRERVEEALRRERIDLYPYLRFRTESEQRELEAVPAR